MVVRKLVLSEQGQKALGHIFKDYVPLQDNGIFSVARIDGVGTIEVFRVDWASLSQVEREGVLAYMEDKFNAPRETIEDEIERNGCFPIRSEYIVFSVDPRLVIA